MENKETLHHVTKVLTELMFFSGVLVCAFVPAVVYQGTAFFPVKRSVRGEA